MSNITLNTKTNITQATQTTKTSLEDTIKYFNSTMLALVVNVAEVCPMSQPAQNLKKIKKAFNTLGNRSTFLDVFVDKLLTFKDRIDKRDDTFFLEKHFQNEHEDILEFIAEINILWPTLIETNKNIVWDHLDILYMLAQEYIINVQKLAKEKQDKKDASKSVSKSASKK